jgi:REP-associated tyrosine transposase
VPISIGTGADLHPEWVSIWVGIRTQEYNQRKDRQGAFWEDRYHATAIEAAEHLHRCLVYIDLNMVRAGMVSHPGEWAHSGYREIEEPPKRYAVIDLEGLGRPQEGHPLAGTH